MTFEIAFGAITTAIAATYFVRTLAKPKINVAAHPLSLTQPMPGSAEKGTWYSTDLLVWNSGRKDLTGEMKIVLCLPANWGIDRAEETHCKALGDDAIYAPGSARFELSFQGPIYCDAPPTEKRSLKIIYGHQPNMPPPATILWQAIYEGGPNPKRGYRDLMFQ